jgi:hypothetical protein
MDLMKVRLKIELPIINSQGLFCTLNQQKTRLGDKTGRLFPHCLAEERRFWRSDIVFVLIRVDRLGDYVMDLVKVRLKNVW